MTNHRYLETNQEISEDTVCAIIILDKIIVTSVTTYTFAVVHCKGKDLFDLVTVVH